MRAAFLAVALLLCQAGAVLAAAAGTVIGLSGGCFVESAGNRTALALGAAIQVGDTVEVAADGKLKLRMADGSVVAVAAGTRMTVTAYDVTDRGQRQEAVLSLGKGLLRAVVTPLEQPAKFEIKTAVGSAAARSTDWFVETSETGDSVSVRRGSVVVTSAGTGHSVVVPAQRGTRLEAGKDPLAPRLVSAASFARIIGRTEPPPRRRLVPRPERSPAMRPEYGEHRPLLRHRHEHRDEYEREYRREHEQKGYRNRMNRPPSYGPIHGPGRPDLPPTHGDKRGERY